MIIEHNVIGSNDTSYHNFTVAVNGMTLTVSPGSYYRAGSLVFSVDSETVFTIPDGPMNYQICITNSGMELVSSADYGSVPNLIDRLVWFALHDETDLSTVDVNFMRIVSN